MTVINGKIDQYGTYEANVNEHGELHVSNHNNNAEIVQLNYDWTGDTASVTIYTPTTGKTFHITDIIISLDETADGIVNLFYTSDSLTNRIIKGNFVANGGLVFNGQSNIKHASVNSVIKLITSGGCKGSLTLIGHEA